MNVSMNCFCGKLNPKAHNMIFFLLVPLDFIIDCVNGY